MKKLFQIFMVIVDLMLWFVLYFVGLLIITASIATALYLSGLIEKDPSIILEKSSTSLFFVSAILSIGTVVSRKLLKSKKQYDHSETTPYLCRFEVQQSPKKFTISKPNNNILTVYPEHLTLSGKEIVKIKFNEIHSVLFFAGELLINCKNGTSSFIFPSFVSNVSEATNTELFLAMIRGLIRNEDVTEIIGLIQEAQGIIEKKTNVIIWLIKIACFSMLISFFVLVRSNENVGFILFFIGFVCLTALVPLSIYFSNRDITFGNKDRKMHFYFLLADQYLSLLEDEKNDYDEMVKKDAQHMFYEYMERMIKLDPESDYVSMLKERI